MTRGSFRNRRFGGGLLASAGFTAVPQVATLIAALVLSPYIVSKVGLAGFGLWSVVQAILAFAQVGSGGFPIIATRLIAGAEKESPVSREAFWAATLAMVALSAVLVASAVAVVELLPATVSDGLPAGWESLAIGASCAFGLMLTAKAVGSIVQGMQRWDVDALVQTSGQVGWAIGMVGALEGGLGLPGLAIGAAVPGCVGIVGYGVAGHRLLNGLGRPTVPSEPVRAEFRRQTLNLQVVALVGATNAQADRFLLLPFAPLSWVGAYALGSRMASALRSFPVAALAPLISRGSALFTEQGLDGLRDLYRTTLRVMVGYGVALLVAVYAALFPAVLAWLGSEFTISATAAVALGTGYALNLATGPGTALALAAGRSDLDRNYSVIGLALNFALTIPLGLLLGPWGVVLATWIGLVASSAWLLRSVDRWLQIRASEVLRGEPSMLTRVIIGICIGATGVAATLIVDSDNRLVNLAIAAATVFIAVAALAGREISAFLRRPQHRSVDSSSSSATDPEKELGAR